MNPSVKKMLGTKQTLVIDPETQIWRELKWNKNTSRVEMLEYYWPEPSEVQTTGQLAKLGLG